MREAVNVEAQIQELREEINRLMADKDSCDNIKLLELSRKLDTAIYQYIITKTKEK